MTFLHILPKLNMAFCLAILLACSMSPWAQAESQLPASPAVNVATDTGLNLINGLATQGWVGEPANSNNIVGPSYEQNDLLKEYGCNFSATRYFKRGNRFISVSLYSFATSAGAYGAYSVMREGASTVVIRGDASSENDDSISFWQGNYYVYCHMTSQDDEESKDTISLLANMLSAKIGVHAALPDIMTKLPRIDLIAGSEKLLMGPIGVRRYTNLPFVNVLGLNQSSAIAIADYLFEPPNSERLKMTLIEYGDVKQANEIFSEYKANLSMSREAIQDTGTQSLFRLSDSYILCQWINNRIIIVSGAKRKYSPAILMRLISF